MLIKSSHFSYLGFQLCRPTGNLFKEVSSACTILKFLYVTLCCKRGCMKKPFTFLVVVKNNILSKFHSLPIYQTKTKHKAKPTTKARDGNPPYLLRTSQRF